MEKAAIQRENRTAWNVFNFSTNWVSNLWDEDNLK